MEPFDDAIEYTIRFDIVFSSLLEPDDFIDENGMIRQDSSIWYDIFSGSVRGDDDEASLDRYYEDYWENIGFPGVEGFSIGEKFGTDELKKCKERVRELEEAVKKAYQDGYSHGLQDKWRQETGEAMFENPLQLRRLPNRRRR